MLGKILGIVFLLFVFLFTICSCIISSRCSREEEKWRNEKDEHSTGIRKN